MLEISPLQWWELDVVTLSPVPYERPYQAVSCRGLLTPLKSSNNLRIVFGNISLPDTRRIRLAATSTIKLFNKLFLYQWPTYGTGLIFPIPGSEIHWARRRGARSRSGVQGGSPRGAQRPRCHAAAFGIARQSDADRPARRIGGHFGRCPRSAESRWCCFGVVARRLRKKQEPLPPSVWRRKPSARHPGRVGSDLRGGGVKERRAMFGRLASCGRCFSTMADNL